MFPSLFLCFLFVLFALVDGTANESHPLESRPYEQNYKLFYRHIEHFEVQINLTRYLTAAKNATKLNLRVGPNCLIDVLCVPYAQKPIFIFEGSNKYIVGWWFKLTIAEETGSTAISNGKKNVELDRECSPQKSHVSGGILLNFTIIQQPQLRLQLEVEFPRDVQIYDPSFRNYTSEEEDDSIELLRKHHWWLIVQNAIFCFGAGIGISLILVICVSFSCYIGAFNACTKRDSHGQTSSRKQVNGKSAKKSSSVSSKSSRKNSLMSSMLRSCLGKRKKKVPSAEDPGRQISNSLIENLRQTAGASPPIVASSSNEDSTLTMLEKKQMLKQSSGHAKPRRRTLHGQRELLRSMCDEYMNTELESTKKRSFQVILSLQRQSFIHTFTSRYTENMKQLEAIYDACSTILDSDALHKLLKVVDVFSVKKEAAVLNLFNAAVKNENKFVVRLVNSGQLNHASLPNCSLIDAAITIDSAVMFDSCFHFLSEFNQILERERRAKEPSEFLDLLLNFVDQIEEQLKLEQKVENKVTELQTIWCVRGLELSHVFIGVMMITKQLNAAMEKAKVNRRLTIPLSINAVPSHASLVQQPPLYAELKCAMAKRSNSIISKASPLKRRKYTVNEHADLLHDVRRNLRPVKSTQEPRPVARIPPKVESLA
ncbi:hypothetical protein M3Y96_00368300 [Aphelenchoides besseyi]|nr:hypothetical protein M3Y96_00368300 [Aphelenchoides besseyi]